MEARRNDEHLPETKTSTFLRGGAPPIPPHNQPPILTAIGMPDPEDDGVRDVIDCQSEEEARASLQQMQYFVTRIHAKRHPQQAASKIEGTTMWERATQTIVSLYWSAREKIVELIEAINEGEKMASAPKREKKAA